MTLYLVHNNNEYSYGAEENAPAYVCEEGILIRDYHYWNGESGKRYLHTVYPLFECPELPRVNCIFVHRAEDGSCTALKVSRTKSNKESTNLANMRFQAARLGANEIHVHLLTETVEDQVKAEADLQKSQLNSVVGKLAASAANSK